MKTLYPYQQEAVDTILDTSGTILGDECGLGKTVTAIEVVKRLPLVEGWRVLVVCPKSLVYQWLMAINEQMPDAAITVTNRIPYNANLLSGWIISTYPELTNKAQAGFFYNTLWDVVILDEAHRIKNRDTKSSTLARSLLKARGLALTGTPMEKSPGDLWALLNFIAPEDFQSYWSFVTTHLETHPEFFNHMVIDGPKDPIAFGELLQPHMLRRTKEQVAPQLPEKIICDVSVAMSPEQSKHYNTLASSKDILVKFDEGPEMLIKNALALLVRIQQVSTDPSLLGLKGSSGKLLWLDEFLQDHDEPAVVFSKFRDVAIGLAKLYDGDLIVGGSRGTDFIEGKKRLLFGTIAAMGEGLNLQRAKYAIFLDCSWSTIQMSQAIDRIHRIDITEPKVIYRLESCPEDSLVLDALERKWTDAELVYYFLHPDEAF